MDSFPKKRKVFLVIGVIAALLVIVLLRKQISSLFSFGPDFSSIKPDTLGEPAATGTSVASGSSAEASLPPYRGRDPQEVRPLEREVAIFPPERRESMYTDIRTKGAVVKKNPGYLFGWIEVGLLKKVIGDYEGARDAWEYAGVVSPKNSVSFANLGELYWRYLPDYPKSEKNFLISIVNKPDDTMTYVSLSDLYSYSYAEKRDLADDALIRGISANPENNDLVKSLASLYGREGKYTDAILWWEKALKNEPGNKDITAEIELLKKRISP